VGGRGGRAEGVGSREGWWVDGWMSGWVDEWMS